jgi:hypothetical protein
MPNRTFSQNTSCSEHQTKSTAVTALDPSLAGHVFKVYADFAIYDTTSGNYVAPEQVTTKLNGTIVRGLRQ